MDCGVFSTAHDPVLLTDLGNNEAEISRYAGRHSYRFNPDTFVAILFSISSDVNVTFLPNWFSIRSRLFQEYS